MVIILMAECKDYRTEKCPMGIDTRVDAVEGRVDEMDKEYRKHMMETAASQARTQAIMEELAKREKERIEAESKRAKVDAAREEQMMNLICAGKQYDQKIIWKLVGYGALILMALLGLKALIPGLPI